jgi:hypothetical protein
MTEFVNFALNQVFKPKFWAFAGVSFLGVILLTYRNAFRGDIFKSATDWVKAGKPVNW